MVVYLLGRATVPARDIAGIGGGAAGGSAAQQQEAVEGEDAALAHLRTMAALLEQYYHPCNNGRWAGCGLAVRWSAVLAPGAPSCGLRTISRWQLVC